MKIIYFIMLFLISINTYSQRDFSYFTKFEYNIQNLIPVEDGFVVLRKVGFKSIDIFKPIEALRIDTLGNIKWKTTLPGIFSQSEVQGIFDISKEGNNLHVFGSHTDCDIVRLNYPINYCIINLTNGSLIEYGSSKLNSKSDTTEQGAITKMDNKYFSIFKTPDSYNIGTYRGDTLNLTGEIENYPQSFCINHNSNRVLTYKEVDNSFGNDILLQLWDSNLNLVSQKVIKPKSCKYLGVFEKGFCGFFNGGNVNAFLVFDSLLNDVSNTAYLNINYDADNLIVNENRFFIIKNKYPSEIDAFINFNAGVVGEHYKSKWSNILDIKEFNGSTYVLGLTAYNQLFLEKLQNSQSFNSGLKTGIDLEMTDLTGDFNATELQSGNPIFPSNYKIDFQNVKVKIKNNGIQEVRGVEIKTKIAQNDFCPNAADFKYPFPEIHLKSGESKEIDLDPIFLNNASELFKICYSVSTIDLMQDDSLDNNIYCSNIKLVSNKEIDNSFYSNIYPNPVDKFLNIESDNRIEYIDLYDIVGRNIVSKEIQSTHYQLDSSNLPNGYYIIHIKGNDKEAYKRFVVQR